MSKRTKPKRELFSESEAYAEAEYSRAIGDSSYHEWRRIMEAFHCRDCSVLLIVPYDKRHARYRFREASAVHEISCPIDA